MIQVLEVLRRWLRGDGGVRVIAQGAGVDRKTAQRYIDAGQELGLTRSGGDEQLTDEFIARVREVVRPSRAGEHGTSWELLTTHEEQIKQWVDDDLTVAKIGDLLVRRGVQVPGRTLQRFCAEKFTKPRNNTVRVADGDPGQELQTDFGRMGMLFDPHTDRRRVVHALIVVAVWSRHMFVWLTYGQRTDDVIQGLDAAWTFFNGVFPILIPDNLSPVVTKADPLDPRFNDTFLEYSQSRGFLIDAARVRRPKDKACASDCSSWVGSIVNSSWPTWHHIRCDERTDSWRVVMLRDCCNSMMRTHVSGCDMPPGHSAGCTTSCLVEAWALPAPDSRTTGRTVASWTVTRRAAGLCRCRRKRQCGQSAPRPSPSRGGSRAAHRSQPA